MKVLVRDGTNEIGLPITNRYESKLRLGKGKYLKNKKGKSS